jgi:hypothetical protein
MDRAAVLAEAGGLRDKAIELYTKLGDSAGIERANAMPVKAPRPAQGEASDADSDEAGAGAGEGATPSAETASERGTEESSPGPG